MAKRQGLPDAFIQEYILKLPSPKEIGDMVAIEMAEHSPKLAMVRAIQALMKAGRMDEAEQLMRDLYRMEMAEAHPTETMEAQAAEIGQPAPSEPPPVVEGEAGIGAEALVPPLPAVEAPPAVEGI